MLEPMAAPIEPDFSAGSTDQQQHAHRIDQVEHDRGASAKLGKQDVPERGTIESGPMTLSHKASIAPNTIRATT